MAQPTISLGWDNAALIAGANTAARTVKEFEGKANASLASIGTKSVDIGGFTGQLFAAVGAVAGLKAIGDEFDRIAKLSVQLNTSPESLQRIGLQAELAGAGVETVSKALLKFNRNLRDSSDPKVAEALAQLQINASQFLALNAEDQVVELARAFQEAEKRGEGTNAIFALLGKSSDELLPLLRSNVEALDDLSSTEVISQQQIADIEAFNDSITALLQQVKAGVARGFVEVGEGIATITVAIDDYLAKGDGFLDNLRRLASLTGGLGLFFGDASEEAKSFADSLDAAQQAAADVRVEAEATADAERALKKEAAAAAETAKEHLSLIHI